MEEGSTSKPTMREPCEVRPRSREGSGGVLGVGAGAGAGAGRGLARAGGAAAGVLLRTSKLGSLWYLMVMSRWLLR